MKKHLFLIVLMALSVSGFSQVQPKQLAPGTNGQALHTRSGIVIWDSTSWNDLTDKPVITGGTVTSVDLSAPSIFNVSGGPITNAGTISLTLAAQSANTVFAGPGTGTTGTPSFRALVGADIPNLDAGKITTGTFAIARIPTITVAKGGTGLTSLGTAGQLLRVNTGATALEYFTPDFIGLSDLSATAPITYNSSTGAIGVNSGNLVAGTGITFSGTATNRLLGTGNLTINANINPADVYGTDTTIAHTVVSGDISAGVVTIALGQTPKAQRNIYVFVNGVKAPWAAISTTGSSLKITNASMDYNVSAGDKIEVGYTY